MNAKELRIGNIVKTDNSDYYQITGFDIYKADENNDNGFIPIELTEEILLKCRFKWNDELFELDGHEYRMYYKDYYIIHNTIGAIKTSIKIKCDTLHQLQNLYFALTGKELEIQL